MHLTAHGSHMSWATTSWGLSGHHYFRDGGSQRTRSDGSAPPTCCRHPVLFTPYPLMSPERERLEVLPSIHDQLRRDKQRMQGADPSGRGSWPTESNKASTLSSAIVFSLPRTHSYRRPSPWGMNKSITAAFTARSAHAEQSTHHRSPSGVLVRTPVPAQPPQECGSEPTPSPSPGPRHDRSSRYLREIDRREILARIANGEKQAVLAREYKVSRSTICNLNKQREQVLARADENPLSRHPKRKRVV